METETSKPQSDSKQSVNATTENQANDQTPQVIKTASVTGSYSGTKQHLQKLILIHFNVALQKNHQHKKTNPPQTQKKINKIFCFWIKLTSSKYQMSLNLVSFLYGCVVFRLNRVDVPWNFS